MEQGETAPKKLADQNISNQQISKPVDLMPDLGLNEDQNISNQHISKPVDLVPDLGLNESSKPTKIVLKDEIPMPVLMPDLGLKESPTNTKGC